MGIDNWKGSVLYWARPVAEQLYTPTIWNVRRASCPSYAVRKPGSKVRNALRLVAAGMSQKEAAQAVGVHKVYVSQLVSGNPRVKEYLHRLEADIDAGVVNMSVAMRELGRRGVGHIAQMMESDSVKDELRLKAAMDLADRSPETSKTSKISIEGDMTLRQGDATALMQALVEAAEAERKFRAEVESGDYVKIDTTDHLLPPGAMQSMDASSGAHAAGDDAGTRA